MNTEESFYLFINMWNSFYYSWVSKHTYLQKGKMIVVQIFDGQWKFKCPSGLGSIAFNDNGPLNIFKCHCFVLWKCLTFRFMENYDLIKKIYTVHQGGGRWTQLVRNSLKH